MDQFFRALFCLVLTSASVVAQSGNGYIIKSVQSDKKWRTGVRSEPYNKISAYFEEQLGTALRDKGLKAVPALEEGSYEITLELLEVTTHPAAIKKPGIDASATVTVRDAAHHILYTKGYRGESRTMMNTYGHLIHHAIEDMTHNVMQDSEFLQALSK